MERKKPKAINGVVLGVIVPRQDLAALRQIAASKYCVVSDLVREMIREYLRRHGVPPTPVSAEVRLGINQERGKA